jgi:hypothetical protein
MENAAQCAATSAARRRERKILDENLYADTILVPQGCGHGLELAPGSGHQNQMLASLRKCLGKTGADAPRGARDDGVPFRRVICLAGSSVFQANVRFSHALIVDREMTLLKTGWMHGVGIIIRGTLLRIERSRR